MTCPRDQLQNMPLHHTATFTVQLTDKLDIPDAPSISVTVLRVLGGWIYKFADGASVFVPLSKELCKTEDKE